MINNTKYGIGALANNQESNNTAVGAWASNASTTGKTIVSLGANAY